MPEFLNELWLGKPIWSWIMFHGIVIALMAIDLGMLHKKQKEVCFKESMVLCGFYALMATFYGIWVWHAMGEQTGKEFFTGYIVEFSLSMDNVFVINLIIAFFAVPRQYQHKVLFWGILGVIVLRGLMIGIGAALVREFEWLLLLFGAFLVITGVKMLFSGEGQMDVAQNPVLKWMNRKFRITQEFHGARFFIKVQDKQNPAIKHTYMTPLFVALMVVNVIDLIFALDSIPAIFAITTDTFVVYTSNIFAILGLRALYFALSAMVERFQYLKYALALILVFIGSKPFFVAFTENHIDISVSLCVTLGLLAGGIIFSLIKTKDKAASNKVH